MQTGFRTNFSWKRGFSMMMLTLFSFSVAVAQVLVRGTVVDQTGESVPGASIQIKGGTQGTITDLDGKFSLNTPNKKSILIVSFIGYVTQELPTITTSSNVFVSSFKMIDMGLAVSTGNSWVT